ncbi:hypothetical protein [Halobellus inordinatus]|uniref:hypothetical protein n=1 Tax=Halobellus inordinatus TaxID=1126236 RepID=UPI00211536CD|nr:hypothetical protein [Halobellus ramosii]
MFQPSPRYPDTDLRKQFQENRDKYEQLTAERAPPELTELLDVSTFWDAEVQLLDRVPHHISQHGYIKNKRLLEAIALWKFPIAVGKIRENPEDQISAVTEKAFRADTAEDAIATLSELSGVGDSIAGTILMFTNPQRYTVMDPRATGALAKFGYWNRKQAATRNYYEDYCLRCHELSQRTGFSLRDVDRALFIAGGGGDE